MDFYIPFYRDWREEGVYGPCRTYFQVISQITHEAAQAHGIPVIEVLSEMNGPDHSEDPRDRGLILEDGRHANGAGRQVIAEAFRKAGYEFVVP